MKASAASRDADKVAETESAGAGFTHLNPLIKKEGVGLDETPYHPHFAWIIEFILFGDRQEAQLRAIWIEDLQAVGRVGVGAAGAGGRRLRMGRRRAEH